MSLAVINTAGALTGQFNAANASSITITSGTASNTNVLQVLIVQIEATSSAPTVSSITGTNGLSWTKRSAVPATLNGISYNVETWWAYSTGALSSKTYIINLSGTADEIVATGWTISGVTDTTNPWDSHSGLPTSAQNTTSTSTAPTVNISTSQTNDLIVGTFTSNNISGENQGTGYTSQGGGAYAHTNNLYSRVEYQSVSSVQTNLAVNYPTNRPFWLVTADALTSDSHAITGTATTALTGISQSASGLMIAADGQIAMHLTGISQSLSGSATAGVIREALTKVSISAAGYSGPYGAAITHLTGISQRALGAKLKAAGTGSFYSWWFLGS